MHVVGDDGAALALSERDTWIVQRSATNEQLFATNITLREETRRPRIMATRPPTRLVLAVGDHGTILVRNEPGDRWCGSRVYRSDATFGWSR